MEWMQWHCGSSKRWILKRWSNQCKYISNVFQIQFIHTLEECLPGDCFPPQIISLQSTSQSLLVPVYSKLCSPRRNFYFQSHSEHIELRLVCLVQWRGKAEQEFRTEYKSARDVFLQKNIKYRASLQTPRANVMCILCSSTWRHIQRKAVPIRWVPPQPSSSLMNWWLYTRKCPVSTQHTNRLLHEMSLACPLWCKIGDREERHGGKRVEKKKKENQDRGRHSPVFTSLPEPQNSSQHPSDSAHHAI